MPRFFFSINESADQEGVVLTGSNEAHNQAMMTAGELLKDLDGELKNGDWRMHVTDEAGDTVCEVGITVRSRHLT